MKRALSGAWLTPLRILLVAILAQPAVATLIHDTAARYGISGVVIAAVEGAIIAYHSKSSRTAPDEYAELGRIFEEFIHSKTTEAEAAQSTPPAPDTPKATG